MSRVDGQPLYDEEKERAKIEWENKVLAYLMPIVGLVAFIVGLVGFILVINEDIGIAIFSIVLAVVGLGGIAYGVVVFIRKRQSLGILPLHRSQLASCR